MIHLLFGKDNFRARRRLTELRDALKSADDMLESNTSVLDGRSLQAGELVAHASASPFLASARLVIVEGLIAALASERKGRPKKGDDDPLAPWRAAVVQLADPAAIPATTTLVFFEGHLAKNTAAYGMFSRIATVEEFDLLTGRDDTAALAGWVNTLAEEEGAHLSARAAVALTQLSGGDLWAVKSELGKLAAFADGSVIEPETLNEAGSLARETKIWDVADAIVAGDERRALGALERLIADGEPVQVVQFMVVRQFRQLVLVKDMSERGVRADEITRASGAPSFRLAAIRAIASRYSWQQLRDAYTRILDADLNVKRGLSGDHEAFQLLVHELCAAAPRGAAARR